MILENQKESQVLNDGETQESIKMSLDLESAQVLMQMLSKNLYSDAIGSTVRETASNALDSHRRAGVDKPIIVSLKSESGGYEFSVEDFGVGLDDEEIRFIISKYGKSTKRNSAIELGMMGLGFKAPLAYTSSFYFVCRKDGMERKYMMYEGEDGNAIDSLYETPTTKPNGVKVIIPVNYYDVNSFRNKIKEQLAYFEDVYFDVVLNSNEDISNRFNIFRNAEFQYSELSSDRNMHLCLDNVYYPIDYQKLGINQIPIPIALRFGLSDKIFPTPNRESIRYTEEAKTIILEKIKKVADYFVDKYNNEITKKNDIKSIKQYYATNDRYVDFMGSQQKINAILRFSSLVIAKPKIEGVDLIDLGSIFDYDTLTSEYDSIYEYKRGKIAEVKNYKHLSLRDMFGWYKFYVFSDKISGLKKEYLKSQILNGECCTFIKKVRHCTLFPQNGKEYTDCNSYYTKLGLSRHPKSEWRQRIKEFQYVQSLIFKDCIDIDKIEISQDWLDERRAQRIRIYGGDSRRQKLQGEVNAKIGSPLERTTSNNCKFVPVTLEIAKLHKYPGLTVYAKHEDSDRLDNIYNFGLRILTFSDRELKVIKSLGLHNLIHINTFMEGENKPFKRFATAFLINDLMSKYSEVFSRSAYISDISTPLFEKVTELKEYRKQYYRSSVSDDVKQSMIEVATNGNLFDTTIYSTYIEVKNLIERLPFLNPLLGTIPVPSYYHEELTAEEKLIQKAICDLFKYYKERVNITIKPVEDKKEQEIDEE